MKPTTSVSPFSTTQINTEGGEEHTVRCETMSYNDFKRRCMNNGSSKPVSRNIPPALRHLARESGKGTAEDRSSGKKTVHGVGSSRGPEVVVKKSAGVSDPKSADKSRPAIVSTPQLPLSELKTPSASGDTRVTPINVREKRPRTLGAEELVLPPVNAWRGHFVAGVDRMQNGGSVFDVLDSTLAVEKVMGFPTEFDSTRLAGKPLDDMIEGLAASFARTMTFVPLIIDLGRALEAEHAKMQVEKLNVNSLYACVQSVNASLRSEIESLKKSLEEEKGKLSALEKKCQSLSTRADEEKSSRLKAEAKVKELSKILENDKTVALSFMEAHRESDDVLKTPLSVMVVDKFLGSESYTEIRDNYASGFFAEIVQDIRGQVRATKLVPAFWNLSLKLLELKTRVLTRLPSSAVVYYFMLA
ncbi:hypothetical protein ACP275_10G118300 [Erythranthe tilingii]